MGRAPQITGGAKPALSKARQTDTRPLEISGLCNEGQRSNRDWVRMRMGKKEHQSMPKREKTEETKKPVPSAKERNYAAYDEVGEPLPPGDVSTEQLDSIISLFGEEEVDIDIADSRQNGKARPSADDDMEEG